MSKILQKRDFDDQSSKDETTITSQVNYQYHNTFDYAWSLRYDE